MTQACQVRDLNRSTVYGRLHRSTHDEPPKRSRQQSVQPRALSAQARTTVIDMLHSEAYCDQPPAQVYHSLLEQQRYLCSISTMHRLLSSVQESCERRHQWPAQHHAIPRLLATAPNDVWARDITKLPLVRWGIYLSMYALLDLFSRFLVA